MSKATKQQAKKRGAPYGNRNASRPGPRLVKLGTTVSIETFEYLEAMRELATPGKIIDEAIAAYKAAQGEK